MEKLFYDSDSKLYTTDDIRRALVEIGAADSEVLFIHSDVMFGKPAEGFKRRAYLETLYEIVSSFGNKKMIVPTFTYSFCNRENYAVMDSKTSMGAFNEYVRKIGDRYRTDDPLLSISTPMELKFFFSDLGEHSLGLNSGLDRLHHMDGVKFLFLGAEMAECFTYVHYVEKILEVPYRFDMPFEGEIKYPDGTTKHRKQYIHTQCYGVKLPPKYDYFEEEMADKGYLKKVRIGDKYIGCISEKDAYREIKSHIENNIYYFLEKPFKEKDLIHKYTYNVQEGRITHC